MFQSFQMSLAILGLCSAYFLWVGIRSFRSGRPFRGLSEILMAIGLLGCMIYFS